jgi:EAL domain-containing protein (putative c-di-GMP-specific phosphodiesterase class I)
LRVLGAAAKPVDPLAIGTLLSLPPAVSSSRSTAVQVPEWLTPDVMLQAIRSGELTNEYQPKVALGSGELLGVETLLRWRSPIHGAISPEVFIPFAEEHDIIQTLTHHVLSEAFQQMRQWDALGLRFQVAVNISMDDLDDLNFPNRVDELAKQHGGTLTRLTLEVTESRLMKNPLRAVEALGRLRLKRVSLSIDDYGTGHSSLSQLRDLPFDELKLDRSFVQGASSLPDLRCILESTVRMASTLELHTVAEGIETLDEWRLLQSIGCEAAQGWLISRSMPGADLQAWLARWPLRREQLFQAGPA